MANTNAPFGFKYTRLLVGAAPNCQVQTLPIAYNNAHTIGQGDVVIQLSSGNVDIAATTDNPILGIFDGVQYYDTALKAKIWTPAWLAPSTALSGSSYAKVIVDPYAVFEVQSSGANISTADIGANATFVTGTPSIAGISTEALDQTSLNTTNTLPFRIVDIPTRAGIDSTGSYNIVEVVMNTSTFKQTTGV